MLPDSIKSLVRAEHRQDEGFLGGVDVETYLTKLDRHAEFVSDHAGDRCRGFVAFYCNDQSTKMAYITLVLVDSRDRRSGLGRALVNQVIEVARRRGFRTCRLEVANDNFAAVRLYEGLGFATIEARSGKVLMETAL